MTKITSLSDLRKMKESYKAKMKIRENSENPEQLVQIKISMATCGIASGAKDLMDHILEETERQALDIIVTQTGCMGYCFAEPTIEVILPGKEPVVFGYVNNQKADEIISKYIKNGELVDGILPKNYEVIDNN